MKLIYTLTLLIALSSQIKASEKFELEKEQKPKTCGHTTYEYLKNKAAGLYYLTSVSGHSSRSDRISPFFEKEFMKEKNFDSETSIIKTKRSIDRHNNKYKRLFETEELKVIDQYSEIKFFFQEGQSEVKIFSLCNLHYVNFYRGQDEKPKTYNQLIKENVNNLTEKSNHLVSKSCGRLFDCEECNDEEVKEFLKHVYKKFENKRITLFSLTGSMGHLSYTQIKVDSERKNTKVKIIDSSSKIIDGLFDLLCPVSSQKKMEKYFQGIVNETLEFSYHCRGDQVINMHDCGRFGTIYFLAELEEKDALNLSNYEVYKGLKILQQNGYDEKYHQQTTEEYSTPFKQSKFSYFIGGFFRGTSDFLLTTIFKK